MRRRHLWTIAEADDRLIEETNKQEQQSLNLISLMKDPYDVIEYSRNLQQTMRNLTQTNKDMIAINDPLVAAQRIESLDEQMKALQNQFGYTEDPAKASTFKVPTDLFKMAKESYGVALSLEYNKALKEREKESALPKLQQRINN